MLHELVFALLGSGGGVFVPHPPIAPTTFAVSQAYEPLLHPAERQLMAEIAHLGFLYGEIGERVRGVRGHDAASLYLAAACEGVDRVLEEWRTIVLDAERRLLGAEEAEERAQHESSGDGDIEPEKKYEEEEEERTTLTGLRSTLGQWFLIMPELHGFVTQASSWINGISGAQVLDDLERRCENGMPLVRDAFQRILQCAMHTLAQQCVYWMVYGVLRDPQGEFFVRRVKQSAKRETQTLWSSQYTLNDGKVPQCISLATAHKMVFIGKAHLAMQGHESVEMPRHYTETCTQLLREAFGAVPHHAYRIESAVERVHQSMGRLLWQAITQNGEMAKQFQMLREYSLLRNGDFFTDLAYGAIDYKAKHGKAVREGDLLGLWRKSISKTLSDAQAQGADMFRLRLAVLPAGESAPLTQEFPFGAATSLRFAAQWPLGWVVPPHDLGRLDRIFHHLFSLKIALCHAHAAFARANAAAKGREALPRNVALLVSRVNFFVSNLAGFFQQDVIDLAWRKLEAALSTAAASDKPAEEAEYESSSDGESDFSDAKTETEEDEQHFDALTGAWATFLAEVEGGMFLHKPKLLGAISKIVLAAEMVDAHIGEPSLDSGGGKSGSLAEAQRTFETNAQVLQQVFLAIRADRRLAIEADEAPLQHASASTDVSAIERLLARLDFNQDVLV